MRSEQVHSFLPLMVIMGTRAALAVTNDAIHRGDEYSVCSYPAFEKIRSPRKYGPRWRRLFWNLGSNKMGFTSFIRRCRTIPLWHRKAGLTSFESLSFFRDNDVDLSSSVMRRTCDKSSEKAMWVSVSEQSPQRVEHGNAIHLALNEAPPSDHNEVR